MTAAVHLLCGPAGSGKTTLAVKYALASVNRGEPAALYTFDEGIMPLVERSNTKPSCGIPASNAWRLP